ncbi:hypothetical protein, partial [Mycobacterium intracellulare]|uniref:hypothetical protein n=1 Tax=Mycobacterium intracellulare TaxID=1767 RepID=UPI001E46A297
SFQLRGHFPHSDTRAISLFVGESRFSQYDQPIGVRASRSTMDLNLFFALIFSAIGVNARQAFGIRLGRYEADQ